MIRTIQLAVACVAVLVASAGRLHADVIITYQDVGSNLQFDFSGTLNGTTNSIFSQNYSTVSAQGNSPVFYSASNEGYVGTDNSVTHTPGPFATNLPTFTSVQGTKSGTSLLFRLNGGDPGPASSLDLWGDWGAANMPINGQLIIFGQSAAGIGMVDGWNVQTEWGSITFQAAAAAPVPEPASLAIWGGLGLVGLFAARRRRLKQAASV